MFSPPPSGLTDVSNPTNLQNMTVLLVALIERYHPSRALAEILETWVECHLVELVVVNSVRDELLAAESFSQREVVEEELLIEKLKSKVV